VRPDGKCGADRPPDERTSPLVVEIAHEEPKRERTEQDREGIGAGLLRVPDEERVDGHDRRGHERNGFRYELTPGDVGHRHSQEAAQRRQRTQPDLPGAQIWTHTPGKPAVQRRDRLTLGNGCQQVVERLLQQLDGYQLVVVETLGVEREETQRRCDSEQERQ